MNVLRPRWHGSGTIRYSTPGLVLVPCMQMQRGLQGVKRHRRQWPILLCPRTPDAPSTCSTKQCALTACDLLVCGLTARTRLFFGLRRLPGKPVMSFPRRGRLALVSKFCRRSDKNSGAWPAQRLRRDDVVAAGTGRRTVGFKARQTDTAGCSVSSMQNRAAT